MLALVVQLALDDRRHQCGKWQLLTASNFENEKLSEYIIAAVMDSNHPTRSIFIILVSYGIISSSFLQDVRQDFIDGWQEKKKNCKVPITGP